MAVDYLSAINRQGSGLNITEIVDSLVEAETAHQVNKIQKDIDNRNAAISGYAVVANELSKLKTLQSHFRALAHLVFLQIALQLK